MKNLILIAGVVVGLALPCSWAVGQPGAPGRGSAAREVRPDAEQRGPDAAMDARKKAEEAATAGRARAEQSAVVPDGSEEREGPQNREVGRGPGGPRGNQEQSAGPEGRERSNQGQIQRQAAQERQAGQVVEIHDRRMAQLERLRALAMENDRPEMVSRVDGLIEREKERHLRHTNRIQGRETGGTRAPQGGRPPAE